VDILLHRVTLHHLNTCQHSKVSSHIGIAVLALPFVEKHRTLHSSLMAASLVRSEGQTLVV
jgi:hypothetical protein